MIRRAGYVALGVAATLAGEVALYVVAVRRFAARVMG